MAGSATEHGVVSLFGGCEMSRLSLPTFKIVTIIRTQHNHFL